MSTYKEADDWLAANGPGGWIDDLRNDQVELFRLRAEVERLCAAASQASFCLRIMDLDSEDVDMTVRMLHEALGRPIQGTP